MDNRHAGSRPGYSSSIRFLYIVCVLIGLAVVTCVVIFQRPPWLVIQEAYRRRAYWAQAPSQAGTRTDSLVLERRICLGTCPAYRVTIAATGLVSFRSRNPEDSSVGRDSVSPAILRTLVAHANAAGFFQLPPKLVEDRKICPDIATDEPTVVVSIFTENGHRIVEDYHGCFQKSDHSLNRALISLRAFETTVDSALGSARWIRQAHPSGAPPT